MYLKPTTVYGSLILPFMLTVPVVYGQAPAPQGSRTPDQSKQGRPLTLEDRLLTQSLSGTALSPSGNRLAVVIGRPKTPGEYILHGDNGRADVWLVSTDGKHSENITNGARTSTGYWQPVWAPDGKRIAILSSDGQTGIRVYVYEVSSRRLRRLHDASVDTDLSVELSKRGRGTFVWSSATTLILGLLPAGVTPLDFDEEQRTAKIANAGATNAMRGLRPSANVLVSGDVVNQNVPRPVVETEVTEIDVVSGATRVLTRIPLVQTRLGQRVASISPNGTHVAILAVTLPRQDAPARNIIPNDLVSYQLGVARLGARGNAQWIDSIRPVLDGSGSSPSPIRWNNASTSVAVIGHPWNDESFASPNAYVIDVTNPRPVVRKVASLFAEQFQWTANDELLVFGHQGSGSAQRVADPDQATRDDTRNDWWLIGKGEPFVNLTGQLRAAPRQLLLSKRNGTMWFSSGGQLWSLDLATSLATVVDLGSVENLRLESSFGNDPTVTPPDYLVTTTTVAEGSEIHQITLQEGAATSSRIGVLRAGTSIRAFSRAQQSVIYQTRDSRIGKVQKGATGTLTLVSLNRRLDEVFTPQFRYFDYATADGQKLTASLLLPYDYKPNRRYPVVVHVYAGFMAPTGDWAGAFLAGFPDAMLLASGGYAVLMPSIPLDEEGIASDPMASFDRSVSPAVDKAIELGLADKDRIALTGVSYGGYTTLGLVTQTHRYKAAVALASASDLPALYGGLDPRYRFSDVVTPLLFPYQAESQQMRMGGPLWSDRERYIRNSPYYCADAVTTPVMLVHGDADVVPLDQAERFFVALARFNKPAKLVRYHGEGHTIESPFNVHDMYQHIFAWFDDFCDIARDNEGDVLWEGTTAKSRVGAPPLKPEDFGRFDLLRLKDARWTRRGSDSGPLRVR